MRDRLKNFNIIPCGNEKERPVFFKKMIECILKIKKYDCGFLSKIKEYNSKKTYEVMIVEYGIRPKMERYIPDCTPFYTNIHDFLKDTRLKELNYKVLMDGLLLSNKFKDNNIKCHLCKKEKEDLEHLFIQCEKTKEYFQYIKNKNNIDLILNRTNIIFQKLQSKDIYFQISIFKYSIWKLRNYAKNNCNIHIEKKHCIFLLSLF